MDMQVEGHWPTPHSLALSFTARLPDLALIRIPPPRTPAPADGLWQRTCFEVFIAGLSGNAYQEYNLSPSGEWARYRFSAERVRDTQAEAAASEVRLPIRCETQPGCLLVQTALPLADLPHSPRGWLLGLTAVVESADGSLAYWALHHPRPQPDFHHPAGRLLRLSLPALT